MTNPSVNVDTSKERRWLIRCSWRCLTRRSWTPKNSRQKSASPHFGRTWMTNYWLQVNFRGTPESSVVWRFKLAMWKVSGIKIESAAGRQSFLPKWHGTLWKMENFRKSVRRRKFSMWKFSRDSTMLKLSSRGFRKCGTFWACELLKWSYCCSKSDDVGRTRVASKIRWGYEKAPRSQFWL